MVADAMSVRHAIGWQPRYALKQTLEDIYMDWKERLAND
jgi:nucleoside-diphosphate-sugar epimerase